MLSASARKPCCQGDAPLYRTSPVGMTRGLSTPARTNRFAKAIVCTAAVTGNASKVVEESLLARLKAATKQPGAVPTPEVMQSVIAVEKAKAKPDAWESMIAGPSQRWRLTYTLPGKDVAEASKKGGKPKSSGRYFPIAACQKFNAAEKSFENGVFLGNLFHLTFKGPYMMTGRVLYFDVGTMYLGLGPLRIPIPLKKDCKPLEARDPKEVKKLPFFVYAWADNDIIVARGRSGGVALWGRADSDWQARAGVLQVYK